MLSYRTYAVLLAAAGLAVMSVVLAAALWLEPLRGDLTRLGGYSENDFGWRAPQAVFDPPLAVKPYQDKALDVVVFGDSFSWQSAPMHQTPSGAFWTDHLAAMTGWRVGVAGRPEQMAMILASDRFQRQPPLAIVLQVVERELPGLGARASCDDMTRDTPSTLEGIAFSPVGRAPEPWTRQTSGETWEQKLSVASDYIRKALLRTLLPWNTSTVLDARLARDDLFSSSNPGILLYYIDDRAKQNVSSTRMLQVRCGLRALRSEAARLAPGAAFVLMVAPDKSTAYAEFMPILTRLPNLIERLAEEPTLDPVRLDTAFRSAVRSGVRDLYLPNDTHWGTAGARLVAATIRDRLVGTSR
jgi:hypothetical protein